MLWLAGFMLPGATARPDAWLSLRGLLPRTCKDEMANAVAR